ncbi:hypothetical protein GCM10022226_21990 [Sphaerisporangium flaviroseum]|uniref:DUF4395 domain-containing protein n=1 Tax=Sphaerisporangium flaviroseum TaxID=509199 RepID=A0ABP7HSV8_9ACTN
MKTIRLAAVARALGLSVPFGVLIAAALSCLTLATLAGIDALYGLACACALLAGVVWDRQIVCTSCHQSLQDPDEWD